MDVLVCIKRVPLSGGKFTITDSGREIETANLGFTISPHEEVAVEEAVRIVEQHGGSADLDHLDERAIRRQSGEDEARLTFQGALLPDSDPADAPLVRTEVDGHAPACDAG